MGRCVVAAIKQLYFNNPLTTPLTTRHNAPMGPYPIHLCIRTWKLRAPSRQEHVVGQQQLVLGAEVFEHVLHGLRQPRLVAAQHRRLEHQLRRSGTR